MKNKTVSKNSNSFQVRFGGILDSGMVTIPRVIIRHYSKLGISPEVAMFIVHILDYKWDASNPYPSLNTIADSMGVSRRTVGRYLETLKEKRLVKIYERFDPKLGQQSNLFDFQPLVDTVLREEKKEPKNEVGKKKRDTPMSKVTIPPMSKMTTKEEAVKEELIYSNNSSKLKKEEEKGVGERSNKIQSMKDLIQERFGDKNNIQSVKKDDIFIQKTKTVKKKKASLRLVALTKDISQTFGDSNHIAQNVQQMKNILALVSDKGYDESSFIEYAYGVKGLVKENIHTIRGSKMGYYFKSLRFNLKLI